jgi:hypothetical protein
MVRKHAYAYARIALVNKTITISPRGRFRAQGRRSTRSQIRQPQLDAFLPLPAVGSNIAGGVQRTAAVFQKRFAQRLPGGAERNRIHKFPVARSKACTDMIFADRIGVHERMGR